MRKLWTLARDHFAWDNYGELYAGLALVLSLVVFQSFIAR